MTFVPEVLNSETIETLKEGGLPVIIFGASTVGNVLLKACNDLGISIECFCENNLNKTREKFCGVEVVHVPELKKKYPEAIFLISVADIKDVVEQLQLAGYSKWYPCSLFLRDFDIYKYPYGVPMEFVEYVVSTGILCHDNYLMPDRLFLKSVDIVITERCSLRCRDCSNLMRYYKNPKNYEVKEIMKWIDKFFSIVDEVNEFRVIGGEPFMNKDWHLIVKRLIEEPKVKNIVIYTNGTIVPREDQLQFLKDNKVLVLITDYGKLSRNLNSLIHVLRDNDIAFYDYKARGWTDCSKIIKHDRDVEGQKEIFKKCCAKNTITLMNGKLYRCPFVANADTLRAVPHFEGDFVDIFDESIGVENMKKRIQEYLLEKEYLNSCDYCSGRSFGDPEIEPSVQMNEPREYLEYPKERG